jgi:hypothetical protein
LATVIVLLAWTCSASTSTTPKDADTTPDPASA